MARDGIDKRVSERTGRVSYRARVSWTDATGKRCYASETFDRKRDAERWRRDTLARIDRGDYHTPSPVPLAEVAAGWLAGVERSRTSSTALAYRGAYERHVGPRFGTRAIGTIRADDVQALYDELAERYRAATVVQVHKVLRGIFAYALRRGLVRDNPAEGRDLPSERRTPGEAWTPEQARAFLAGTRDDAVAAPLVLMLATGIRIGECLALLWEDVDLAAGTIEIRHTIRRSRDGITIGDTAKTRSSERVVILSRVAHEALCRQRARVTEGPLVFPARGGRVTDPWTVRRRMTAICERLGLPDIAPHGLRRTCATLMLRSGVNLKVAADQLGHSVEQMLTTYVTVDADMQQTAATALDATLGMPDDEDADRP